MGDTSPKESPTEAVLISANPWRLALFVLVTALLFGSFMGLRERDGGQATVAGLFMVVFLPWFFATHRTLGG